VLYCASALLVKRDIVHNETIQGGGGGATAMPYERMPQDTEGGDEEEQGPFASQQLSLCERDHDTSMASVLNKG
jgi:hypothetical protein